MFIMAISVYTDKKSVIIPNELIVNVVRPFKEWVTEDAR